MHWEFSQTSRNLYQDFSHSSDDRNNRQDNGRTAFRACSGEEANHPRTVQQVLPYYFYKLTTTELFTEKFAKKLLGDSKIETILRRLDRLTQDESRMTEAHILEVVYGLMNNMNVVMEGK